MDDLREQLTRKVGPFQVWQWAAIIVAGVLLGRAVQQRLGGGAPAPRRDDNVTGEPFLQVPTARVGGPDNAAPGSTGTGAGPTGPTDNPEWLRAASARLRESQRWSSAQIDTALRRYLDGAILSEQQVRIVSAALDVFGPPPDGAPSMVTEPAPSAPPPSTAPPGTGTDASTPPPSSPEPAPSASWAATVNGTLRGRYDAAPFVRLGVQTNNRGRITRATWSATNHGDQSGVAAAIIREFVNRDLSPPNPERLMRLILEVLRDGRRITGGADSIAGGLDAFLDR